MRRISLLIIFLILPLQSFGLGLGGIRVQSSLTEPLQAEIPLMSVMESDLRDIHVSLAEADVFDQRGVDRTLFLTKLRFKPMLNGAGEPVIYIDSLSSVREPYLRMILEVRSTSGTLFREYALLLDPPEYKPMEVAVADAGAVPEKSRVNAPESTSTVATDSRTQYGPVKRSETLWVIAERLRADNSVSVEQMMLALQRANPDAFIGNNINRLKQGAILNIPSASDIGKLTAADARRRYLNQNRVWHRSTAPSSGVSKGFSTEVDEGFKPVADQAGPAEKMMETESAGRLRVVETGREWLLSHESHPGEQVYPANEAERLQVEIANSRNDLETVNEINQNLEELKGALESKVQTLTNALAERDKAIASLKEQLVGKGATSEEDTISRSENDKVIPITTMQNQDQTGSIGSTTSPTMVSPADTGTKRSFWIDERWLIGGGVILIGLLILLFLFVRGRRVEEEQGKNLLIPTVAEVDALSEEDDSDQLSDKPAAAQNAPNADEQQTHQNEYQPPADVGAVLTEADIFLAYRRYTQAEELIHEAMEEHPEDPELMCKLLEIYAFRKDREGYSNYLTQVADHLQKYDSELWERVLDMTYDLVPNHPLLLKGQQHTQSAHQRSLNLGENEIRQVLSTKDEPDVSVDELSVLGESDIIPKAVQNDQAKTDELLIPAEPYNLGEETPIIDEITLSQEKPLVFNLEDQEDLDEHDIVGLDIDLELREDQESDKNR